jgi:amylosucrase
MTNNEFNLDISMQRLADNLLHALPVSLQPEIAARFSEHAPLLISHLHKLYGSRPEFIDWLSVLMRSLGAQLAQRPEALRTLDRQRAQHPDWFRQQNMAGYCAYVDRLGGTLKGVQTMIPHLQQLGITYLHLLPFLRARAGENDGGFAVASFLEIEPALGSMQDLSGLAGALRSAGISLCSDFILNHVADTHEWAESAIRGDLHALGYFHTCTDRQQVDDVEASLNQVFPEAAPGNFTWNPTMQRWVWTTFYPYQWDLNYANPDVFANMVGAMLNLANQGVEVFRLDSTAYIWKRPGSNCMNQPEVHLILQAMRSIADIVAPAVLLKAEAIVPTAELQAYLGGFAHPVPECHLAYHSTLMAAGWTALASQNVELIRKVIEATPSIDAPVSWLTYVRCHDDIGWNVLLPEACANQRDGRQHLADVTQFLSGVNGGYGRGVNFQAGSSGKVHGTNGMTAALCGISAAQTAAQLDAGIQRMLLLYGLACSFGGMPLIYMGDELAQDNDYAYLTDPARENDSRWLQRPFLDRTALQSRYDADSKPGKVFGALCRLLQTRKELPQLASSAPRTLLDSGCDSVLAFTRTASGSAAAPILVLANFSDHAQQLDLQQLTGTDTQHTWLNVLDQSRHANLISLPAWSQHWLTPDVG